MHFGVVSQLLEYRLQFRSLVSNVGVLSYFSKCCLILMSLAPHLRILSVGVLSDMFECCLKAERAASNVDVLSQMFEYCFKLWSLVSQHLKSFVNFESIVSDLGVLLQILKYCLRLCKIIKHLGRLVSHFGKPFPKVAVACRSPLHPGEHNAEGLRAQCPQGPAASSCAL